MNFETFNWAGLDGKTLRIGYGVDTAEGFTAESVVGKDVDTGVIYVLHSGKKEADGHSARY